MRILVLGASGFIGRRVVTALLASGHQVLPAGRQLASHQRLFPACEVVQADLASDTAADWLPRLAGVDAVVNLAGILRGDLEQVQHRGPASLFDACAAAGVKRLLHVSAVGAGVQPGSAFLRTRHAADLHLLALAAGRKGWGVIRPSLVIGRGGASTRLFLALAALPRPVRLGAGCWAVQPLHVDDAVRAIVQLLHADTVPACLDLVGPDALTTDELTAALRGWLGLPARPWVRLPLPALRAAAWIGQFLPGAMLTQDSLAMLQAGNTANAGPLHAALGWRARSLGAALAAEPATQADLWLARLTPVRPVLLGALCLVWVGTGVVSALLSAARADTLLAGFGLAGWAAHGVTLAGAVLDAALGLALLSRRLRARAAAAQLAVMAVYSVLATVALPGLWADPFGPLLKNLAVAAATLALLAMQD